MMGTYAMYRNVLLHDYDHIKPGLEYAVFPNLHKVSDSYVATMLSKSTRKSLILQMRNELKSHQKHLPL